MIADHPDGLPEPTPDRLTSLEHRLARLEEHLGLAWPEAGEPIPSKPAVSLGEAEENLELQLGQNWFAKAGVAILGLGVVFLLTFPFPNLPSWAPSLAGYFLVAALIALSHRWRERYQQISRYLLGSGLLLLYFTTLRLAHFSPEPAIGTPWLEAALLLAAVLVNLTVAVRRHSPYLAGMGLVLGCFTALAGGEAHFAFVTIVVMSAVTVCFHRRYAWETMPLLGTILALLTHGLWALNSPVLGNPIRLVTSPETNLFFLLAYPVVFAVGNLLPGKGVKESPWENATTFLSGGGSYGLLLLLNLGLFPAHLMAWQLLASFVFMGLAILAWLRRRSEQMTFVYAMLAYSALSVAIVARSKVPQCFAWLCWQSLLVVSTAVWFRSRFIVVGNFAMYLIVFVAYLAAAGTSSVVAITFGLVALLSARILNWQKDRLELKTELMRNAYLTSALVMIPYGLSRLVPAGLVSLSWLGLAACYYLFSRWLKNRKYRWMALLTTAFTILRVFLVDLTRVAPTLRIVSFLALGSVLLVISMVYSQRRLKTGGSGTGTASK
jgi:uncharacterized membrane protein